MTIKVMTRTSISRISDDVCEAIIQLYDEQEENGLSINEHKDEW